jgi:hypothetical protein
LTSAALPCSLPDASTGSVSFQFDKLINVHPRKNKTPRHRLCDDVATNDSQFEFSTEYLFCQWDWFSFGDSAH